MAYDVTFYFENNAIANKIALGASWEQALGQSEYCNLTTVKLSTAIGGFSDDVTTPRTSPWDACCGQWISASQSAREWTAADKFDISVVTYETDAALNASLYVVIRVVSSNLATVRGILYDGNVNTTEFEDGGGDPYSRRHADEVAIQNSVTQQATDKIVVELGARCASTSGAYAPRIYAGTAAGSNAPLSDASGVDQTTMDPWIAFTYGAGGATPIVKIINQ